jgi:hypothetical protein
MINILALDDDNMDGKNHKFADRMRKAEQSRKTHKQEE